MLVCVGSRGQVRPGDATKREGPGKNSDRKHWRRGWERQAPIADEGRASHISFDHLDGAGEFSLAMDIGTAAISKNVRDRSRAMRGTINTKRDRRWKRMKDGMSAKPAQVENVIMR